MPGQAGPSVTVPKGSPPVPQKSQSPQQQQAKETPGSTPNPEIVETRKGQPGSHATYPNGLRDVHEMAAAAEALTGLGGETNQAAERKRESLSLTQCLCMSGTGTDRLLQCRVCSTPATARRPAGAAAVRPNVVAATCCRNTLAPSRPTETATRSRTVLSRCSRPRRQPVRTEEATARARRRRRLPSTASRTCP